MQSLFDSFIDVYLVFFVFFNYFIVLLILISSIFMMNQFTFDGSTPLSIPYDTEQRISDYHELNNQKNNNNNNVHNDNNQSKLPFQITRQTSRIRNVSTYSN